MGRRTIRHPICLDTLRRLWAPSLMGGQLAAAGAFAVRGPMLPGAAALDLRPPESSPRHLSVPVGFLRSLPP